LKQKRRDRRRKLRRELLVWEQELVTEELIEEMEKAKKRSLK